MNWEAATAVKRHLNKLNRAGVEIIKLPEKLRYPTDKYFRREHNMLVHVNQKGGGKLARVIYSIGY